VSYATIDDLRANLGATHQARNDAYAQKQLHQIPEAPEIDREGFILDLVKGKRVLEFGASGALQAKVAAAASLYAGVDRAATASGVLAFDIDDVTQPDLPGSDVTPELIVCGEVVEHLGNPQYFLARLKRQYPGVPVLITTPNAMAAAGLKAVQGGIENVNIDHVCWYSYRTLKTLLGRVGYTMTLVGWYHGAPRLAEGLVVLAE